MTDQKREFDEDGELVLHVTANLAGRKSVNTPYARTDSNSNPGTIVNIGRSSSGPGSGTKSSVGSGWAFSFNNGGSVGGGFSGGFGGSSRKRAKKRARARAQAIARQRAEAEAHALALHQAAEQAAVQARSQAEAQALAQHQAAERAAAQARAEAEAHARAQAEAIERARVEREQTHRRTIETLTAAYSSVQSELALRYSNASEALADTVQREIESGLERPSDIPTEQQLRKLILQEKAQINYLIATKQAALENRNRDALSFSHQDVLESTQEHYQHYLERQSHGDPAQVHSAGQSWSGASTNAHEAKLLAKSIALLNEKSTVLSERHAELSLAQQKPASHSAHIESSHAANVQALWSSVLAPAATPAAPVARNEAIQLARKYFIEAATKRLGRNIGAVLAAYPRQLANAERAPAVVATPLAQLNLPAYLDLEYVASVNGTIDVPHRLVLEGEGENRSATWATVDGVKIGTKVRVRTFTYNTQNNTYEFIRDGESTPALIWTPIVSPSDSSTISPSRPVSLPVDPGVSTTPAMPEIEVYPGIDANDPDDYILISPPGSGLPDSYLLFKDPRSVPGIASGYGEPVTGTWLGPKTRAEGAPIPSHIADELRGQRFGSFDRQREAIWKAVAKDSELGKQFTKENVELMKRGEAPFPQKTEQAGGRTKFELHHKNEIANGGAVYDMDNLVIMTPKQHIEHHRGQKNDL